MRRFALISILAIALTACSDVTAPTTAPDTTSSAMTLCKSGAAVRDSAVIGRDSAVVCK